MAIGSERWTPIAKARSAASFPRPPVVGPVKRSASGPPPPQLRPQGHCQRKRKHRGQRRARHLCRSRMNARQDAQRAQRASSAASESGCMQVSLLRAKAADRAPLGDAWCDAHRQRARARGTRTPGQAHAESTRVFSLRASHQGTRSANFAHKTIVTQLLASTPASACLIGQPRGHSAALPPVALRWSTIRHLSLTTLMPSRASASSNSWLVMPDCSHTALGRAATMSSRCGGRSLGFLGGAVVAVVGWWGGVGGGVVWGEGWLDRWRGVSGAGWETGELARAGSSPGAPAQ